MILEIYLLVYLWVHFEPLQEQISFYFEKKLNKKPNTYLDILWTLIQCFKCLVFWTTLIFTQDIFISIVMLIIATIHKKYLI